MTVIHAQRLSLSILFSGLLTMSACDSSPTVSVDPEPDTTQPWGLNGVVVHRIPAGFQIRSFSPDRLNNAGEVAGAAGNDVGTYDVAIFSSAAEEIRRRGKLYFSSEGYGNNNTGHIAGYASGRLIGGEAALLVRDDSIAEIFPGLRPSSQAYLINDRGHIVGSRSGFGTFLLTAGELRQILMTWPASMNEAGEIAGWNYFDGFDYGRAAVYRDGQVIDIGLLGSQEGDSIHFGSRAFGINDSGIVVGSSLVADGQQAFFYDGGLHALDDFDSRGSEALDIDNAGRIVGYAGNTGDDDQGIMWVQDGELYKPYPIEDMINGGPEESGWYVMRAMAISDTGRFILARAEGGIVGDSVELWRGLVVLEEKR